MHDVLCITGFHAMKCTLVGDLAQINMTTVLLRSLNALRDWFEIARSWADCIHRRALSNNHCSWSEEEATPVKFVPHADHVNFLLSDLSYFMKYLDTWSDFEAAKPAPWPSRSLHHLIKFRESYSEIAGRGSCCFLLWAHQEWTLEICWAQILISRF